MVIYHCEMDVECYQIRKACNARLIVGKWTPFVQIRSNRSNQLENRGVPIKTHFIMNVLIKEL